VGSAPGLALGRRVGDHHRRRRLLPAAIGPTTKQSCAGMMSPVTASPSDCGFGRRWPAGRGERRTDPFRCWKDSRVRRDRDAPFWIVRSVHRSARDPGDQCLQLVRRAGDDGTFDRG
jgi:hypothetical protein